MLLPKLFSTREESWITGDGFVLSPPIPGEAAGKYVMCAGALNDERKLIMLDQCRTGCRNSRQQQLTYLTEAAKAINLVIGTLSR
jgi:hypothetical protein